jgi:hypothetical protein
MSQEAGLSKKSDSHAGLSRTQVSAFAPTLFYVAATFLARNYADILALLTLT